MILHDCFFQPITCQDKMGINGMVNSGASCENKVSRISTRGASSIRKINVS